MTWPQNSHGYFNKKKEKHKKIQKKSKNGPFAFSSETSSIYPFIYEKGIDLSAQSLGNPFIPVIKLECVIVDAARGNFIE